MLKKLILGFITVFILSALIVNPNEMLNAASESLILWFNIVVPSLFPFIAGINILSYIGAQEALGKIFKPFITKIFNVSECCAFPFVMGMLSGCPAGGKIVSDLKKLGKITQVEAQRALSFSSNPGPLFVIGTVGTGMLKNTYAGYFLLFVTISSSILTGIIFRFYKYGNKPQKINISKYKKYTSLKTGDVLKNSIYSATETITQVGGFIILFGVVLKAFEISGIIEFLSQGNNNILSAGLIKGIIEMTNGSKALSSSPVPIATVLPYLALILSWNGFSIHAQVLSFFESSDINSAVYLFSKFLQSLIAFLIAKTLFPIFEKMSLKTAYAFSAVNYEPQGLIFYSLTVLTAITIFTSIIQKFKAKQ